MTNYRRAFIPGGTFFFTVVTYHRRPILTSEPGRVSLREAIRSVQKRRPFTIDAIVLLPDHLHCIWSLPRGDADFSTRWRQIKTLFTRSYLSSDECEAESSTSRAIKQEHAVWQRRFFEHTIQSEEELKRCVDYIHINPVKHGLVEKVSDWPWSSFHRYVQMQEYPLDWGGSPEWFGDEWDQYE
ncbi:MAG: transposase [Planctomycetaceae bacterium]|nr:transposase [Planctomycetaceae bacterium]